MNTVIAMRPSKSRVDGRAWPCGRLMSAANASADPEASCDDFGLPRPYVSAMPSSQPSIAEVAALVGNPARANVLLALLDGRALTATELAYAAGVSPQTTSGHLAKLSAARLLVVAKQGRHSYFRLA